MTDFARMILPTRVRCLDCHPSNLLFYPISDPGGVERGPDLFVPLWNRSRDIFLIES